MSSVKGTLRELLPALVLTGIGALAAGWVLGSMVPRLEASPGVLIIVPGLMALRGNINGAMGSRLGSALHLGLLDPAKPFGAITRANFLASLSLSLTMGAVVGAFGWLVSVLAGLSTVSIWVLMAIGALTAVLSGALLSSFTIGVVIMASRQGLDPDNVTSPLLSTVGDLVSMGVLFVVLGALG